MVAVLATGQYSPVACEHPEKRLQKPVEICKANSSAPTAPPLLSRYGVHFFQRKYACVFFDFYKDTRYIDD
jgi:hypothetical protein